MRLAVAGLLLLTLAGCGAPAASQEPSASASTRVIEGFELYTHCGIRETKIGGDFYTATPVLADGNGNPPGGWGNPGQVGTMTVYGNGTARFSAPGGLEADFRLRPGATTWVTVCS